jgi:hypothetical protein
MKSRFVFAALLGAALVSAGAMHSAAQDGQKKAAPKKSTEQKQAPKKATPKATQKKAEPRKEPQKKSTPGVPGLVAQYGDWGVYVNKTAKTCFALTQPKERQPANVKRGPAYFFVTTRPEEKLINEISIMTGFALREDAAVALEAAGSTHPLYVKGSGLWIREPANEQKLLAALQQEKEVWLKLTPARGAETNDRYSLTGLTQALERVAKECP